MADFNDIFTSKMQKQTVLSLTISSVRAAIEALGHIVDSPDKYDVTVREINALGKLLEVNDMLEIAANDFIEWYKTLDLSKPNNGLHIHNGGEKDEKT